MTVAAGNTVAALGSAVFRLEGRRIWVAGHRGMVGSAVVRRLATEDCEVLTVGRDRLDLRDGAAVDRWLADTRPEVVVLAAARVGGILANARQPADFLYDNLAIAGSVIHAAFRQEVAKLLFLGSSCIYPKLAPQPMPETALLTGPLEPTNEGYAIAKIAGIKLCEAYRRQHGCDFISAMPTNLYGPNDSFHPENSHVLPALLRKVHEAKAAGRETVELWGSGRPRREFLHVDDLADACVHLLRHWSDERTINVGTGTDIAIAELAALIAEVVGWRGRFVYDPTKPDGTPRKLLDVSRLTALGWTPRIPLREGIAATSRWYLENAGELRHG
ncbi:GDP-L-fucose synthase [Rhodocista pekingensis]|uniref:GDP-L-fucose synthase n=1 Tax=Rhodocista pekingensis TaxID=201185 RepID=A0ABW2KZW6_9PROT